MCQLDGVGGGLLSNQSTFLWNIALDFGYFLDGSSPHHTIGTLLPTVPVS